MPRDPPTLARFDPFVPLFSVAAETVEPVLFVRVGPPTSSDVPNAPAARPNYIDDHREMGAR